MTMTRIIAAAVAATVLASAQAWAAPVTFFGEDIGQGEDTRLASHANADAARTTFLSNLSGVGTETFEGFSVNQTVPMSLNFPGAVTANLSGSGEILSQPTGTDGFGRYPISGDKYLETNQHFVVEFTTPMAAFGFYGVDVGDFQGQLTITYMDGTSTTLTIPHVTDDLGGAVMYFGFIDTDAPFTRVEFGTTTDEDWFAFDDMTVALATQIVPETPTQTVPEPASAALLGFGLAAFARRRRRQG